MSRKPRTQTQPIDTTSVAVTEEPKAQVYDSSVESLLMKAVENNVPVETLEKLFTLRTQVKAELAKEAYVRALAEFQSQCPAIIKNKKVLEKDKTRVRYMYASLDSIVEQVKVPLRAAELSYRWETSQENNQITATCIITHALGHSERSSFTVGVDPNQYMTSPQRFASGLTFAKRYTLLNSLGILTADEDTDATDTNQQKDVKNVKSQILFLLRELKESVDSPDAIEKTIKRLTKLTTEDKNLPEIKSRLEAIVIENRESHENSDIR